MMMSFPVLYTYKCLEDITDLQYIQLHVPLIMVKDKNCLVKIKNFSGMTMKFSHSWYDAGRLADGFEWPASIKDGDHAEVLSYERDWSLAGCSGYVTYIMGQTMVTIAFSNPSIGYNKLGVGISTHGKDVWDEMGDHNYQPFNVILPVDGKNLIFYCQCTGSSTNNSTVEITPQ